MRHQQTEDFLTSRVGTAGWRYEPSVPIARFRSRADHVLRDDGTVERCADDYRRRDRSVKGSVRPDVGGR